MRSKPDVAIIGAGIIGAFCALYLIRNGCRVTLIDGNSAPFLGSTAAGFGSLTPFSDPFFKGEISKLASESVHLYRTDITQNLGRSKTHLSSDSLIHLLKDEREQEYYLSALRDSYSESSGSHKVISRTEALSMEPAITDKFFSAIEYKEPWIDLESLMKNLSEFLDQDPNFRSVYNANVTVISDERERTVLRLQNDETMVCDFTVLCTGAGLKHIAGIPRPNIRLIRGDAALAKSRLAQPLISRHIYMGNSFITPRMNGEHLLGATYDTVLLPDESIGQTNRHSVVASNLLSILDGAISLVPQIAECEVQRLWHGYRPSTPSGIPFVGRVPTCERTWAALGFIGLGVTLAPAVGVGIANAIMGRHDTLPTEMTIHQNDLWEEIG